LVGEEYANDHSLEMLEVSYLKYHDIAFHPSMAIEAFTTRVSTYRFSSVDEVAFSFER
jgi:hypothetical protein